MQNKRIAKRLLFPPPPLDGEKETNKSDYSFELKLGDGAFGQVWRIKHKKSLRIYACKQVAKERVVKMLEQFRREVLIMYELSHVNIIRLYHHFEDQKYFYLVMELAESGNLFHKLVSEKSFIEKTAFEYFSQVLEAVEYLHSHTPAIIHRDIKPENILITKSGVLKLTDFGWSNYYYHEQGVPRYTMCGTFEYLAPEMVKESGHTPSVDIWCLGILLYEMMCGYTPFKASTKEAVIENISKGKIKFPRAFPAMAKELILKILEKNPNKRISIERIKKHEWYKVMAEEKPDKALEKNNGTKISENPPNRPEENEQIYSKTIRKSLTNIKQELITHNETGKEVKEKILNCTKKIREKNRLLKITEQEVLKQKILLLNLEYSAKEISESILDKNIELEKQQSDSTMDFISENISKITEKYLNVSESVAQLRERLKDTSNELEIHNENFTDRERYLKNLQQYYKRLKSKGSSLHRGRSQVSSLQVSCEVLKEQIIDHDKNLELTESDESKYYKELIRYIQTEKEKIGKKFVVEEKLKNTEDAMYIKELEMEKLKKHYVEQRNFLHKKTRIAKEKIVRNSLEIASAVESQFEVLSKKKELLTEEILFSRNKEKVYMIGCADLKSVNEKILVRFT